MPVTLTDIKADVGSVAGHVTPHPKQIKVVKESLKQGVKSKRISDFFVSRVGDDIHLIMLHSSGEGAKEVHGLAWDALKAASEAAKGLGLYAAGQDLLKDAFSGNVKGMGPGIAEMEFEPRKAEPMIVIMADKTGPSAFNLPLSRIYADPFTTSGLVIDSRLSDGFIIEVMDQKEGTVIPFDLPAELHSYLALIGDVTKYTIKRVRSKDKALGTAAVVSTDKLSYIAGKYVGKDDPVAVLRAQSGFPAVGEILQPFMFPNLVGGWMRGSHVGPLFPSSSEGSNPTFFDGPPRVVGLGFMVNKNMITGIEDEPSVGEHTPVDYFSGEDFQYARQKAMEIAVYMRQHGPFMYERLPEEDMEYTTLKQVLEKVLKNKGVKS
ncbi:MAG: fructose 1,6-bisphosphatase [Nitrososphaerota archaeon]|jgi:fructose 1,6-bisphosphate aldolase/phosphatase|nr:fructose 1,6-bisphosphatase [Nitrososphaerota archaeon]MDG6930622.1 fructose 1,6-bisphosphatase [Nitrososphaerota archaeon]MDG6932753.1 fructose 1,6-bisphosphatase [Nitrososphaerota archaeon]MDG6935858.1 fructose 1,6-bisphosphatase [Nitrososphaerota archaeon]MDG6944179.1 fructose 1,6-bisphosphatase [Nitrososphaerota archaeon]